MSTTPTPNPILDTLKARLAAAHAERNKSIAHASDCRTRARDLEAQALDADTVKLRNEGVIAVLEDLIAQAANLPDALVTPSSKGS